MSDYKLTAGQQQQLIDFLDAGKSIYLEGNDFGYYHKNDSVYKKFGITYLGDGNSSGNVQSLQGKRNTILNGLQINYTYGSAYPDQYVDYIAASGADILYLCQGNKGRGSIYAGPNGTFRAIYSAFWFGAMKNSGATHTKNEIMAAYLRYLRGGSLVAGLTDRVSVAQASQVELFLENEVAEGGRSYGILGSVTGTAPGLPVGSVVLPLNYDPFMSTVVTLWNTSAFTDFVGSLSASGRAKATFDTLGPIDPALAGYTLYFAYLLTGPIDFASNPAAVEIVP